MAHIFMLYPGCLHLTMSLKRFLLAGQLDVSYWDIIGGVIFLSVNFSSAPGCWLSNKYVRPLKQTNKKERLK